MAIRPWLSRFVQYLYFLRFSILSWCLLPALASLDHGGYTTTITRAFFAPNSPWQAFNIAFFSFSFQIVVLITARNICINGEERFGIKPPQPLPWLFCDGRTPPVLSSLVLAQMPAARLLAYVAHTAKIEAETHFPFGGAHGAGWIWLDFAVGIVAALFFWYSVSLFYYWTYTEQAGGVGKASVKPLIFPNFLFGDLETARRPIIAPILELPLRGVLKLTYHGFGPGKDGPLWELHFLSFVSFVGFFLLYLFLYALTAPVRRPHDLIFGSVVACLLAVLFIIGVALPSKSNPPDPSCKWELAVKIFFITLGIALAFVFVRSAYLIYHYESVERVLPVLATILVIASFALWAFAGMGFLLDRYRIPVLTSILLVLFVPKLLHKTDGEHYFTATSREPNASLPPSPRQALEARMDQQPGPLIIVTATGGGIHAALWTTEILGRLERGFAEDPDLQRLAPAYRFHDHILLASSVSGGSVGLMSFLLEYTATPAFDPEHLPTERMSNAAACSSIEDVAWGLEYYDLVRFVTNIWYSWGGGDPPDRNWALTQAFNRNLSDPRCLTAPEDFRGLPRRAFNGESFTLGKAVDMLRSGTLPAFAINTTAVETGGRFLLANYQIPRSESPTSDLLPAESFLHAYGEPCDALHHDGYADLPIASAARLSATFPLVSSASRIPKRYAPYGYHFVDGGYYDNDGTASAVEFLQSALSKPAPAPNREQRVPKTAGKAANVQLATPEKKDPCTIDGAAKTADQADAQEGSSEQSTESPRIPILLIEIRNGDDLNPLTNVDDFNFQEHPKNTDDWTAVSQLNAPLGALWQAGHESVTRRNRLGLCLLETSYAKNLTVHHVVFNYDPAPPNPGSKNPTDIIQPLNWHLTSAERADIESKARSSETSAAIKNATSWVRDVLNAKTPEQLKEIGARETQEECSIGYVRVRPAP